MLRPATVCFVLAAALLAGCASQDGGAPTPALTTPTSTPASPTPGACPSEELRLAAYEAADGAMKDFEGVRFSGSSQGTFEGDAGTISFAVDPAQRLLDFRQNLDERVDVRVNGTWYSIDAPDQRGHGRDLREGAIFDLFYADFLEGFEEDGGFEDSLVLADYNTTCKTVAGVEVVEFRYEEEGKKMVMQMERAPPHRPIAGEYADPLTQDNQRLSFTYDAVSVKVDDDLPKFPVDMIIDVLNYTVNERGGITMTASISDETAWVPLEDLDFRLMDTEGRMWFEHELADGFYDMEDGDTFEFDDVDGNGLLSERDVFTMDVGAQLDIVFFDTWADQVAAVHGQA